MGNLNVKLGVLAGAVVLALGVVTAVPSLADGASGAAGTAAVASADLAKALAEFDRARAGASGAAESAAASFKELARRQPQHPVLLAYQGSATAMQGRDAWLPWKKLKLAEQGADTVEKAVTMLAPEHDGPFSGGVPESLEARLVAASTLSALPDMFNRSGAARRISDALIQAPLFAAAPGPFRAESLHVAANVAGKEKRAADELALLRQAVAAAPGTKEAASASARLKELGQ